MSANDSKASLPEHADSSDLPGASGSTAQEAGSAAQRAAGAPSPGNPQDASLTSSKDTGSTIGTAYRGLTEKQFQEVKGLIDSYLNHVKNAEIKVYFPPWWIFLVGAMILIGGVVVFECIRTIPELAVDPNCMHASDWFKQYQIIQHLLKHVTLTTVALSGSVVIYKLALYVAKQYYHFQKAKILATNRIAIFATVLLNGGKIEPPAFEHFVSNIAEPSDMTDLQTLHEKVIDNMFGVLKEATATGVDGSRKIIDELKKIVGK